MRDVDSAGPITPETAEVIAERLRVLGQPVRVRLVDRLEREGEMSVGALADALGESLHNVSQHLAILRTAGVVRRCNRGREVWYRLSGPGAMGVYEQVVETLLGEIERLGRAVERADLRNRQQT